MKLNDYTALLESLAPAALAQSYDNVGLMIGTEREIRRVLVALDCTPAVAEEAVQRDVDLVLTHHPLFFHPARRILPDDPDTAPAYKLIQHGIGLYAAHTNLDTAEGGVNDALAEALGLTETEPLFSDGIGRVGALPEELKLDAFARHCAKALHTAVRVGGDPKKTIRRVGVVGGAGGDMTDEALRRGCDAFVTGEVKHHEWLHALGNGLAVVDAGHYATEAVVLKKWISRLQNAENGVQYELTRTETAPWRTQEED